MKQTKKRWIRFCNRILSGVLVLLGFNACNIEEASYEYGQPFARYEIKGKVIDKEQNGLPEIQIIVRGVLSDMLTSPDIISNDTLKTNSKGEFVFREDDAFLDVKYRVIANDIQTETYKSDSLVVDMGKPTGGDGHWYRGQATKNILLKLTKNAE